MSQQRRAIGRILAGLAAGVLLGLVAAPLPAHAHTELTSSTPAADARLARAPSEILLRFSEEVNEGFTTITLAINGAEPVRLAKKVDGATVTAEAPDRPAGGSWTVAYRLGSADGHPVTGSVTFAVAAAVPPTTPPATANTTATPSPSRTSPAPSTSSSPTATTTSTPAAVTESARNVWWKWPMVALVALTLVAAPAAAAFRGLGVRPDQGTEAGDDGGTSAEPSPADDEPDRPASPPS